MWSINQAFDRRPDKDHASQLQKQCREAHAEFVASSGTGSVNDPCKGVKDLIEDIKENGMAKVDKVAEVAEEDKVVVVVVVVVVVEEVEVAEVTEVVEVALEAEEAEEAIAVVNKEVRQELKMNPFRC
ncbi:unnamed protein product [Phytophthora fragariaefolia]|uniref:Unnamed protein product n=1 Tax=Phytophthora fragariaefolia TaxID=1490495 RepID=A0A9W6XRK1_9STRA|nr:unnamed protein product [Phytophthora fragariaefolia]